jgi:hypothetical protein
MLNVRYCPGAHVHGVQGQGVVCAPHLTFRRMMVNNHQPAALWYK